MWFFHPDTKNWVFLDLSTKGSSLWNKKQINKCKSYRWKWSVKCHLAIGLCYWDCIEYLTPDVQFLWEAGNKNCFGFVLFYHKSSHFIRYGKSHGQPCLLQWTSSQCTSTFILKRLFPTWTWFSSVKQKALLCLGNLNKRCCCNSRRKLSYWFILYGFLFPFFFLL